MPGKRKRKEASGAARGGHGSVGLQGQERPAMCGGPCDTYLMILIMLSSLKSMGTMPYPVSMKIRLWQSILRPAGQNSSALTTEELQLFDCLAIESGQFSDVFNREILCFHFTGRLQLLGLQLGDLSFGSGDFILKLRLRFG